jgi:hypothetical protein
MVLSLFKRKPRTSYQDLFGVLFDVEDVSMDSFGVLTIKCRTKTNIFIPLPTDIDADNTIWREEIDFGRIRGNFVGNSEYTFLAEPFVYGERSRWIGLSITIAIAEPTKFKLSHFNEIKKLWHSYFEDIWLTQNSIMRARELDMPLA